MNIEVSQEDYDKVRDERYFFKGNRNDRFSHFVGVNKRLVEYTYSVIPGTETNIAFKLYGGRVFCTDAVTHLSDEYFKRHIRRVKINNRNIMRNLIGHGGSNIYALREVTQADIIIHDQRVYLSSHDLTESVTAKKAVRCLLKDHKNLSPHYVRAVFDKVRQEVSAKTQNDYSKQQ